MISANCLTYCTKALRVGVFVVVLGMICPAPVYSETFSPEEEFVAEASEHSDGVAEHGEAHGSEDGGHESKGGLPQLDFTSYPSQIFWCLVTFGLLFLVFSRKMLPDISSTIENRREHVQSDLDTAQDLKDSAELARKTYEELLKDANQKALALMHKTDGALKEKIADAMKTFGEKSVDMVQTTEKDLDQAKKKAMLEMHDVAAEVASLAANKIIGVPADLQYAKTIVNNIYKKAA